MQQQKVALAEALTFIAAIWSARMLWVASSDVRLGPNGPAIGMCDHAASRMSPLTIDGLLRHRHERASNRADHDKRRDMRGVGGEGQERGLAGFDDNLNGLAGYPLVEP